ncbi:hypothetical protein Daus18300_007038 [Diaporthe australafricana]|uniref:Microtubule-associated protein Jupiter n=1 Tax=Diaporthe australafricana TaxID=127596 RepID=A0ABR3WQD7_9PEZI
MVGKAPSVGTKVSKSPIDDYDKPDPSLSTLDWSTIGASKRLTYIQVTLGDKAPVTQEGAGNVSGSLAAESAQNGGEFSNNRNINESGGTDTGAKAPGTSSSSTSTSGGAATGAAPTYVNNQYTRDSGGPHGKNITEDPEMTGRPGKFNVEPGSKEDPGRLAEQDLRLKQTRGAPGTGERQDAAGDQQPFAALDNETSA